MPCPFLKEGRARYCHAADMRKLILEGPGAVSGGKCESREFRNCFLAKDKHAGTDRCPHLEEIQVQYCGASPVPKLLPFSESPASRCGNGGYRYCDTYLGLAGPGDPLDAQPELLFAPNHLWLNVGEDGLCHVGVDAFLAEVVGAFDSITFTASQGTCRPSVALEVGGVEWPMRFPNPMLVQATNARVRRDPKCVAEDPYRSGWLFEAWEVPDRTRRGLKSGAQSAQWMAAERERLAHCVHESAVPAGDGGATVRGVARLLPRGDAARIFQQFFAQTSWGGEEI